MKYTDPKVADNVLSPQLIARIYRDYMTYFQPGWKSSNRHDETGHNQFNIISKTDFINIDRLKFPHIRQGLSPLVEVMKIIEEIIGEPRSLFRAYTKLYSYGQDAFTHRDISSTLFVNKHGKTREEIAEEIPGFETCIIYLSRDWQLDWYGNTILYSDDDEIDAAVVPKFNRCLIFDSAQKHASSPLSRVCNTTKKILVLNTMPVWQADEGVDYLITYLEDFGHSGKPGGLLQHLLNCFDYSTRMRFSKQVSLAALWHNVYGTEHYNEHESVKQHFTRDVVEKFIGPAAEDLVYRFCSIKKNRTQKILQMNDPDLIKIELANLTDQNQDHRFDQQCIDLTKAIINDYNACKQSAMAEQWIERLEGRYISERNQR